MSLKEIDKLLEQTDYSTALIELSKYSSSHPEQRDIIQKKIDRIMNSRTQYMILANKLLDVMESDPENEELKLQIISALETVEKDPTEEQLKFIKQAKIASQFTFYRAKFRRLLDEASALVTEQKYVEAVSTIQSGFSMYQKEFFEENSKVTTNEVSKILDQISTSLKNYETIQVRINNSYEAFIKALKSGNFQNARNEFNNFDLDLNRIVVLRTELYSSAESLQKIFTSLQRRNPDLTEASFLPFIFRFIFGLENSTSGIIGIIDSQFYNYVENAKPHAYNTIAQIQFENLTLEKIDNILEKDLPKNQLENISNFSNLALSINQLYKKIPANFKYNTDFPFFVRSMNFSREVALSTNSSFEILRNYQNVNETAQRILQPENALEGIKNDNAYASKMIECFRLYSACKNNAQNLLDKKFTDENLLVPDYFKNTNLASQKNQKNSENKNQLLEYKNLFEYYLTFNKTIIEASNKKGEQSLHDTSKYFALAVNEILSNYEGKFAAADDLLKNHYPREARTLIEKTNSEIDSDTKILTSSRQILLDAFANEDFYSDDANKVISSIEKMNELKKQNLSTIELCNQEILLSERALNEAELRYNQAFSAFRRGNYADARRNVEQSSLKYNESFSHQESESLRADADKKLITLATQINDAEHKIVIAEVRKLKNQAKTEYYNGNFERAENILARAKDRWAVTNGDEEDQEIKNLQVLVSTALSMKTGRVIPPTAPLYPEMSQILSIAHQFFNQGSAALKRNRREEGVKLLTQAKDKLQEIQLVYPLNQEASLLSLRIDQLINPEAFEQMFEQKLNSAKANYKVASHQQTAYTDLLDLYEIRPNYPGLKNLIYQVEIDIGVRQKPVDNSSIIRSTSLTKEAQAIMQNAGTNEAQLRNAISKLDQAIVLNPNNDQAVVLKDRIQVSLGGRASVVLTSSDESKYQQAILELQKNNIIGAYSLVEQLLQKAQNRRSTKVLDLEKKIKALL